MGWPDLALYSLAIIGGILLAAAVWVIVMINRCKPPGTDARKAVDISSAATRRIDALEAEGYTVERVEGNVWHFVKQQKDRRAGY